MSGGDGLSQRKVSYFARISKMLGEYTKVLVVTVDNVGSAHMQSIRKSLRGKAALLMGKNTLMRKAMREYVQKNHPELDPLIPHIYGNIGLVFVNGEMQEVKKLLVSNVVGAYAKVGSISPCEVIVPKGDTGMDPSKTSFFQALSIQTKINKGKIEILNDVTLMKKDEKVNASQAALLQMLNIKPFQYGCKVTQVYDAGLVFHPSILDLTDSEILAKFQGGVSRIAALSLQIGHPTVASLPHTMAKGYSHLVSIALATKYSFSKVEQLKALLDDPEALKKAQAAAAAPAAGATSAPAAAAAGGKDDKKKKKGDDDDDDDAGGGMGGLFGDDGGDDGGGAMGGLFGDSED